MDDNATSLNCDNSQSFHPCLVGLKRLLRDALPVAGKGDSAERTTTHESAFIKRGFVGLEIAWLCKTIQAALLQSRKANNWQKVQSKMETNHVDYTENNQIECCVLGNEKHKTIFQVSL